MYSKENPPHPLDLSYWSIEANPQFDEKYFLEDIRLFVERNNPWKQNMNRIINDKPVSPEEAKRLNKIREQVAEELPDLIAKHNERMNEEKIIDEMTDSGIILNDGRSIEFSELAQIMQELASIVKNEIRCDTFKQAETAFRTIAWDKVF